MAFKIITADSPINVKTQRCGLIRVEDYEQAKRFCKRWNGFAFNEKKKLKAHIHPLSCPYRIDPSKSHHMILHNAP